MNRDFIHRNRFMVSIRGIENKAKESKREKETEGRREEGSRGRPNKTGL